MVVVAGNSDDARNFDAQAARTTSFVEHNPLEVEAHRPRMPQAADNAYYTHRHTAGTGFGDHYLYKHKPI